MAERAGSEAGKGLSMSSPNRLSHSASDGAIASSLKEWVSDDVNVPEAVKEARREFAAAGDPIRNAPVKFFPWEAFPDVGFRTVVNFVHERTGPKPNE
jgi:hypothetical protein